jgi:hypothetical protein
MKSRVEFERIEQWLNLVAPALMRHDSTRVEACDIASLSEVSPALKEVALRSVE